MRLFHKNRSLLIKNQNSFPTNRPTASTPGRLPWEASAERPSSSTRAGSRRGPAHSPGIPTLFRPSQRRIGLQECPEPSSSHSLGAKRVGNAEQFGAVPSTFPSFGTSSRPMGVWRSGGIRKTRKAAGQSKDTPGGKSTPRKKLSTFHDYMAQVSSPTEIR